MTGAAAWPRARPPQELVGAPTGDLPTPALLLDLDAAERNISQMARAFERLPAALRPHVKAHKCAELARLQLAAGATGITCATAAEAAAFARAGITDLLVANQVASPANLRLLCGAAAGREVTLAVESVSQVAMASQAAAEAGVELGVLIEVDVGSGRGGIRDMRDLRPIAEAAARSHGVRLRGLMGYEGHATGERDRTRRRALVDQALDILGAAAQELHGAGHAPQIVSAGGTGTYDMTGADPRVTEVQAGSYAIMDTYHQETAPSFGIAVTVAATVLGRHGDLVVLDAGRKALSGDLRAPVIPAAPGAQMLFLHEEHSGFDLAGHPAQAGDQVRLACGYAPTAVNLYPWYHVVSGDVVVDIWRTIGRHGES